MKPTMSMVTEAMHKTTHTATPGDEMHTTARKTAPSARRHDWESRWGKEREIERGDGGGG
jgi:hypothetical protein